MTIRKGSSGAALRISWIGSPIRAVRTLPEYARPRQLYVVNDLPMTAGFRALKRGLPALVGPGTYEWDARTEHYVSCGDTVTTRGK